MTKPIKTSIIIIIATLCSLLSACGPTEASRVLGEIEDYMYAHPDTRLDELMDIDSAILSRTADRMLYEVLLTQAIDKAHGSLAARDSVMQVAADWFTGRSDTRHALLANYFLGRVKFEKEDYPESLVAMFKAHDLAKELDDKFWIGMSARGIADVYLSTYNFSAAAEYTKVELDNIKQTGRQPYINYAMLDLGRAYCANTQCVEATIILNQIIDSASTYADSILCFSAKELMARTLLKQNNYEEALTILKNISNNPDFSVEDSTFLGLSYLKTGNIIHAQKIMQDLSQNSDAHTQWLKYMVNKSLGSFDEALKYKENDENIQANDIIQRFNVDLYSLVIDYYNLKEKSKAKELKNSQTILWLFIIIVVLISVFIIRIGYNYYCNSQKRIEQNFILAEGFREMLSQKESECNKANKLLREKLKAEFTLIDDLCHKMYETDDTSVARRRISNAVVELIDELSNNEKKIIELEKSVDLICNNVISNLKNDFPNLKEIDYRLFLYTILGFSMSAITFFLKEQNISSIYERKRRLKDKIKKSDNIRKKIYLDFL